MVKFCETKEELAHKYFECFEKSYAAHGLDFMVIALLSDVQCLISTSNESALNKEHYRQLLNDIKSCIANRNKEASNG